MYISTFDILLCAGAFLLVSGIVTAFLARTNKVKQKKKIEAFSVFGTSAGGFIVLLLMLAFFITVDDKQRLNEIKDISSEGCLYQDKYNIKALIREYIEDNKITEYEYYKILYVDEECKDAQLEDETGRTAQRIIDEMKN